MSRGPGVRQQDILSRVSKAAPRGTYILPRMPSPSMAAAYRRAAYKLEASGKILIRTYKGRLVAYAPGTDGIPEELFVQGADGRLYRSGYGDPRENFEEDKEWIAFHERYDGIADKHGHPHGPGILLCLECAEAAGADEDLLDKVRNFGSSD